MHKVQADQARPIPGHLPIKQENTSLAPSQTDHRQEAVSRRKTQEMANNSPQVLQMKNLQKMADDSQVVQRMVAVAGGMATFNKKDFTQLSHLNWARAISGGPVVDLDASIQQIAVDADLHLIQHGQKGVMMYENAETGEWNAVSADEIAALLIHYLPINYRGRIRISSCYSGTDTRGKDSSLVGQVKTILKSSKRADLHQVVIVGWDGPTITNINLHSASGTGAETVDPKKVEAAGKLQEELLGGKYAELKKRWEKMVGEDTGSLENLAREATTTWETFYQEFTEACAKNGLLLKYVDSLVIA